MLNLLLLYSRVTQFYTYIYVLFNILFHSGLSQDIKYTSLCYTVGPCWLSILCIVVCICRCDVLNLSLPCFGNHKFVFYVWVCFANTFIFLYGSTNISLKLCFLLFWVELVGPLVILFLDCWRAAILFSCLLFWFFYIFCFYLFNWSVVAVQYYVSYRCTK